MSALSRSWVVTRHIKNRLAGDELKSVLASWGTWHIRGMLAVGSCVLIMREQTEPCSSVHVNW